MSEIDRINEYLQKHLHAEGLSEVTAVEAAGWLGRVGLLKDSASRPGRNLRNLLRNGRIAGGRQESNRRWFIRRLD